MTLRLSPGIGIGGSAALALAAAALYMLAQSHDPSHYRQALADVQQIRSLASDWSVETARVRTDPLADYDALAAFIPRMGELKRALLATARAAPDIPDRLANDISAFASAMDAKEERIERFKTANSVVRNSARYLPLAAASIVQDENTAPDLGADVVAAAGDIAEFLALPTDAERGRLMAVVERLDGRAGEETGALAEAVASFVAHATVLLERQGPTDEMFDLATSSDIASRSAALIDGLAAEVNRRQEQSGRLLTGTAVLVAALILLWLTLAVLRPRAGASEAEEDARREGAGALADDVEPAPADARVAPEKSALRPGAVYRGVQAEVEPQVQQAEIDIGKLTKQLLSQRILADVICRRIADASVAVASRLESLPEESGTEELRHDATRIAEMAERLLSASQSVDVTYELVNVNDCIGDVVDATGAETVATVKSDKAPVPEVFGSKAEICLMLEKVVENSVQAIEQKRPGGSAAGGEIRISTSASEGNTMVTIIDNGVGMPKDVQERMTEPFFSLKEDREGVGLTTTSHLVEKYGGALSVSSHEGGGTVTRIELPGMS